jgi:hypothetical protein
MARRWQLAGALNAASPKDVTKISYSGHRATEFLAPSGSGSAPELLARLSQGIHHGFRYRRRESKGIQPPLETLASAMAVAATSPC